MDTFGRGSTVLPSTPYQLSTDSWCSLDNVQNLTAGKTQCLPISVCLCTRWEQVAAKEWLALVFSGWLFQEGYLNPWFHSALENSISRVPGMLDSSSFSWTLTIHTNILSSGFSKCAFLQGTLHWVTVQVWTVSWKQLYGKTADLRPLESQWH